MYFRSYLAIYRFLTVLPPPPPPPPPVAAWFWLSRMAALACLLPPSFGPRGFFVSSRFFRWSPPRRRRRDMRASRNSRRNFSAIRSSAAPSVSRASSEGSGSVYISTVWQVSIWPKCKYYLKWGRVIRPHANVSAKQKKAKRGGEAYIDSPSAPPRRACPAECLGNSVSSSLSSFSSLPPPPPPPQPHYHRPPIAG